MADRTVLGSMRSKHARYEALVNAYSADLYRYALWKTRERERAEDLVQETFLRAWRSLHTLRDDKSAKAWLLTILRREFARGFERYTPAFVDDYDFDYHAAETQQDEDVLAVRQAMNMLTDEYREPLMLQVLGGHSCQEIANMLGLTAGTVMTRVFRARRQLLAILEGDNASSVVSGGSGR